MPIFYVRPINGDDTNDGLSFVNAFKTTQQAILGVTTDNGDEEIYLCNEGVEGITGSSYTIRMQRSAARSNPIRIRAADSSGVTGATLGANKYTIQATGPFFGWIATGHSLLSMATSGNDGNDYSDDYRWYDVIFDCNDKADYGYYHNLSAAANANFYGCRFTNARLQSGARNGGYNITYYYACEFDNNTSTGWYANGVNRGNSVHLNCSYHDNGTGLYVGNNVDLFNCRIYDNTNYGIQGISRYNNTFEMTSCVIYNNGSHGYYVNNSSDSASSNKFINNVIVNNGGYGIESNTTEFQSGTIFLGNILKNNTTGSYNFTSVTHPPTGARSLEFTDANVSNADFDSATGKFNYNSEAVDLMFPFGGAPGSVSREGFSVTNSGSLSLGTGDVGDIVDVSGNSFQLVQENPRVWKNV